MRRDFHDISVFCPLGAARIASGEYQSTMRWTKAADEHRKAKSSGHVMPIIFGDAQFNSTHLFKWAQLDIVTVNAAGTRIRFSNVQELGGHFATELIKESDGCPININVRRGYSVVETPDFLPKRSRGGSVGAGVSATSAAATLTGRREANGTITDVGTLGDLTSTIARGDRREADIASVTGLSVTAVRRRLARAHGKTLIRNLFKDHWPIEAPVVSGIPMRQGAVQQASTRQNKRVQPSRTVSFQGRPDHRKMQQNLADLGELRRLHVRTNHPIGAGYMQCHL